VTVNEGDTAVNTGTFDDVDTGDNVSITASVGSVSQVGSQSGTWSWSFGTNDGPAQDQTVTIKANDGNGAVFYQLLTGEIPYPVIKIDDDDEDRGYRRELDYTDTPKTPSSINPAVPPEIDAIALKAVHVDYDARFPTPADLGEALTEVLEAS
jgi:serine/threonine protein kinase